jgi:hypothetical protein
VERSRSEQATMPGPLGLTVQGDVA